MEIETQGFDMLVLLLNKSHHMKYKYVSCSLEAEAEVRGINSSVVYG